MTKKLFLSLFLITLILCFGCGNNQSKDNNVKTNEVQSNNASALASDSFKKTDGTPQLNDELTNLYKDAEKLYSDFNCGNFDVDSSGIYKDGEQIYQKVLDKRFSSIAQLKAKVLSLFTDDFAESKIFAPCLNSKPALFIDVNSQLYFIGAARGKNILYAGHVYNLDTVTNDEIKFTVTIYNHKDAAKISDKYFYTTPENTKDYDIGIQKLTLKKCANGKWRFSEFPVLY